MEFDLDPTEKSELEKRHRVERDGRVRDRIKVVLLKSESWSNQTIAQALRVHPETVAQHLQDWSQEQKLKPENGGSQSKLTKSQSIELESHLQEKLYMTVQAICDYVADKFKVTYTVSGMTKWLHAHKFSYKRPKPVPAKADEQKQDEFIEYYLKLIAETPETQPIVFIDAAHPTMATKISCGWIKKGVDKPIETTASRTRVNVIGAIELKTMNVVNDFAETVNTETMLSFLQKLRQSYPDAPKIHALLDQAGYHRSEAFLEGAKLHNIELHHLPPYSPNLNPIERLWRVMNQKVRDNVVFNSAKEFRDSIGRFFTQIIPKIRDTLRDTINDNFETLRSTSSG